MVGKAQKSHGARFGLYGGCSDGVPPIYVFADPNTEFSFTFTSVVIFLCHVFETLFYVFIMCPPLSKES
jgi:hypothetical protein